MSEVQDKAQRQFGDVKETRANKMFTSALLPFAIHWIQVTACKQNSHRRPFAPAPRAPAAAADRIATATVMIIVKGLTPLPCPNVERCMYSILHPMRKNITRFAISPPPLPPPPTHLLPTPEKIFPKVLLESFDGCTSF